MKCKVKSANVDFVRKSKEGRSNNTFRVGVISKATHETMKKYGQRERKREILSVGRSSPKMSRCVLCLSR